jgi:DNA-binding response OmpR family regulator
VIDDDRKARSLLRAWLREEGYTVKEAAGGNEGIKLAAELGPALIILDILMPDKNGWQVLEELKEDPRTAAIPVMIASVAEEQGLGFSLGAIDYFVKPIDRSKLMDKLADLGLKTGEAVLVIEDNPSDLNLVAALLETEKLHVLRASLGELGLRMARKARPGVIVLDLMLPDMSGFEVIDCLHQDTETSNIPIIVLTMKDLNPEELHVLHQQTAAVLHKAAFKRQDFMAEVTRALRQTHRSGPKE